MDPNAPGIKSSPSEPIEIPSLGSALYDEYLQKLIATLGEPIASYSRALLAADAAARRLHAAQMRSDVNAATDARLDQLRAISEVERIKSAHATTFLMGLRWAIELFPGAVQAAIDPAYRRELDHTQSALVSLENRIDPLEDAVVRLEPREAA